MNVVILSYGPSRVTLGAVKRARRIAHGDPLWVVAVSETGVRRLDVSGVRLASELGTAGLKEVLEHMQGPVLVAHDDVAVTPEAASGMAAELARRGGIVVSYSNDVGTDHFIGTLPPAARAAGRLAELARTATSSEIARFRPTVVVADPEELAVLVETRIVDPRLTIADPRLRVTAAAAVVAHDGVCVSRLLAPEGPDGRPLLVASLIVKDEEETLGDCLASLTGLVDRIEVCDTGSSDRTVEIARRFGANVSHIPWRDDFGWARTEALERCRDAHYALVLDADERIRCDDPTLVRRVLATYRREYPAYSIEVHNWASPDGSRVSSVLRSVRIFRAEGTRYVGALHEMPVADDRPDEPLAGGRLDLVSLVHLGYQADFVDQRGKKDRNLAIAREAYERTPSFKTRVEYARSLRLAGAPPEEILAVLGDVEDELEDVEPAGAAFLQAMAALAHLDAGRPEEALRLGRRALDIVPADDGAAAVVAEATRRLDRPDVLVAAARHRRDSRSVRPLYVVEGNELIFSNRLVWALVATGDLDAAYAEARWLLGRDPESFDEWETLVDALAGMPGGIQALFALVLEDPTGRWVRPSLARLGGEQTAELCHAYLVEGGTAGDAVTAGMLGAAAAGRGDLVAEFCRYLHLLDGAERADLVALVEARGMALPAGAV